MTIAVSMVLLSMAPPVSSALSAPPPDALLPLLVTQGGARRRPCWPWTNPGPRQALAGEGLSWADHFRAGSITKTFIATLVLQLVDEHRLSLSDTVEKHLPKLVRGEGNDGRALTLRSLLNHTSGLYDFVTDTRGTVPVTPHQALRIALTHSPAALGRFYLLEHQLRPARPGRRTSHRSPRTPPRPNGASSLRCG
ncbi:serine hydrolase domain-containing protein [Streptomyces hirsutus]